MSELKEFVFEVVDYSNDDMYYPLAVFKTLEQAVHEIECSETKHQAISPYVDQEYEKIVIRERGIGWTEHGKEVWEIQRHEVYHEEKDKYLWERIPQPEETDHE